MNNCSFREYQKMTTEQVLASLPLEVSINGTPALIVGRFGGAISIGDLHPFVQRRFLAMEKRVRMGMPKGEKLFAVPAAEIKDTK